MREARCGAARGGSDCGCDVPERDVLSARAWTEAAYSVVRWSTPSKGGHFAAMEAPEEFVDDVRSFFRSLPIARH